MTTATATPAVGAGFWEGADTRPGYLKAGFLGFQGTGKTLTATLLAIVTREMFKLTGPISIYDTEGGSAYVEDLIIELTGVRPLIKRSRSFDDLMSWLRLSMEAKASVGIADSVTHPWREMCEAYLAEVNRYRKAKGWDLKQSLSFDDWNVLKPRWARWSDSYLNSPFHLIVNGRAGYEYDMATNEENNKKELIKTGIKMKTEGEFGYEPSLLVQLILDRTVKRNRQTQVRIAQVLKDRFMVLDGKELQFPSTTNPKAALVAVRNAFLPHLKKLTPGNHTTVDTTLRTAFEVDNGAGTDGWAKEKRLRAIYCEEIQGELVQRYPGQTAADKKAKGKLLKDAFGTYSWTEIENLPSEVTRKGLILIREALGTADKPMPDVDAAAPGTEESAGEAIEAQA